MLPERGKIGPVILVAVVVILLASSYGLAAPSATEQLGQRLYFEKKLSDPNGQSCADCHHPSAGFGDPDQQLPVSEGVIAGLFGGRNAPISAYAMYAPPFHYDDALGYVGGQFWDGRATGAALGDPLADQAMGPPLNPVEMANPDKETVLYDILNGPYASDFVTICGDGDLGDPVYVEAAYNCMAQAIGAFERTQLFGRFNSRYDSYLRRCLDMGGAPDDCAQGIGAVANSARQNVLTDQEWYGLQLFMGPNDNDGQLEPGEGAACAACHLAEWVDPAVYAGYGLAVQVPQWSGGMIPPLFADFAYDNVGVPKSDHPLLVNNPIDYGLGDVVGEPTENGKFRVMTLRNIGASAPYLHNGYLDTLELVANFFNTRDVGNRWPAPEVPENVNYDELGNLGLTPHDEAALVAFLRTLTDGHHGAQ